MIKLAWKNIWHRPYQSFLTMLLFSIGILMIVMIIHGGRQLEQQFEKNIAHIDMVVGAKGSPLQLILSSVYHLDNPTGNIPLEEWHRLEKHPFVEEVVPLSLGDNYKRFRIVGTTPAFENLYGLKLASGSGFSTPLEVVLGSMVQKETGLDVGDVFHGAHGLGEALESHDHQDFKVVGVYEQSGTVADQLIFTPLESVWKVHEGHGRSSFEPIKAEDHVADSIGEQTREEPQEITSLLVRFRGPKAALFLPRQINQQTNLQAASPVYETARLQSLTGRGFALVGYIGWLILALSGVSVLFSMIGNMRKRTFEVAVLRVMGAGRLKAVFPILMEAVLIAGVSAVLGLLLGHTMLWMAGSYLQEAYHYTIAYGEIYVEEYYLFGLAVGIGIVSALIPMYIAYKKDISHILKDNG